MEQAQDSGTDSADSSPELLHDSREILVSMNSHSQEGESMHYQPRSYVFGEFFAGMGGLSTAMVAIASPHVKLGSPERLDAYDSWNILDDEDYDRAKELCRGGLDHGHFAPPCRTLTEARRDDEHGSVKVLRSFDRPEGFGDPEADEANKVVERMVVLCLLLHAAGRTFSIENPFNSFLWLLRCMQRLLKMRVVELVLLHQCAYGAQTVKPTGILTSSPWMKVVNGLCHQARPHRHLKTGLTGRVWSYLEDKMVWRSSLAAEYPCGLCIAWARALLEWLESKEGMHWMACNTMVLRGKWQNQLVRADTNVVQDDSRRVVQSLRDVRNEENAKAIGGLRNARKSVMKSPTLRATGERIRKVLDGLRDEDVLEAWEVNVQSGLSEQWIDLNELAKEFKAEPKLEKGFAVDLWRALLDDAKDCEAEFLPRWMREGFPLGIQKEIVPSGVFPVTSEDTAAVEASRLEGQMMDDLEGKHQNYVSFREAAEKGQEILDDMVMQGRAVCYYSSQEVLDKVGPNARLTKLGCIIKQKEDGSEKVRIIVDSRRSGVNGMVYLRERVVLPRMTDITSAWYRLMSSHHGQTVEAMSADFKDAFNMLHLADEEKPYVVVKGMDGEYGQSRDRKSVV